MATYIKPPTRTAKVDPAGRSPRTDGSQPLKSATSSFVANGPVTQALSAGKTATAPKKTSVNPSGAIVNGPLYGAGGTGSKKIKPQRG